MKKHTSAWLQEVKSDWSVIAVLESWAGLVDERSREGFREQLKSPHIIR